MKPKQFGRPGHFCGAEDCHFFRHTHIGKFCVSTVGDYRPFGNEEERTEVGYKRFYETMVFNLKRGVCRWYEIEASGYQTEKEALAGHERICRKYMMLRSTNETR